MFSRSPGHSRPTSTRRHGTSICEIHNMKIPCVLLALVGSLVANAPAMAQPVSKPLPASAFGEKPAEILLWETEPPGFIEGAHKAWPGVGENGVQLVSRIGIPSIILHKPLAPGKNRKAVILCPGGAYQALASVDNGNGTL